MIDWVFIHLMQAVYTSGDQSSLASIMNAAEDEKEEMLEAVADEAKLMFQISSACLKGRMSAIADAAELAKAQSDS